MPCGYGKVVGPFWGRPAPVLDPMGGDKRGSDLTPTLLCYFDSGQNARLAAKRLDIHVNTVRQRLAGIEEILGYFGDATRGLEIHMALRLWNLSGKSNSASKSPLV